MTAEEQVCTLEQAKRLKELGCEQKSLYYYSPFTWSLPEAVRWGLTTKEEIKHPTDDVIKVSASAYTVAELGRMIVEFAGGFHKLPSYDSINKIWYHSYLTNRRGVCIQYQTEAQARAALLIYLEEQL